ncbi:beclin 1 KNAG_0H01510 [Huiozyma naganishii CBS 8797]|uniref:Uncharacterized protein n=1 Tax=Huiozyma naganishii (strain ATCC MYA-139 / BCRC 22969 / CBS 8797 / KCTC 17520 / NBRC 10181 / NCYC 3082 / Yp74L-3) TaxID=1071383 RepID=J7R9N0_HUIN7|nr:hypothetical protein KNAG_0H01510 [Kazachstania naganishii CBS 8797]CCK71565.1 hypothetical protein KNAG_0H01510 [Kazachstania naganishii CBS 8797]
MECELYLDGGPVGGDLVVLVRMDNVLKCQNCRLPLQLDTSLLDLSVSQRDLILSSLRDHAVDSGDPGRSRIPRDRLRMVGQVSSHEEVNALLRGGAELNSYVDLGGGAGAGASASANAGHGRMYEEDDEDDDDNALRGERKGTSSRDSGHGSDASRGRGLATERTLSTQVSALSNIFNILSAKSTVDYPVCQDCCQNVVNRLKMEYEEALNENKTYTDFLNRLETQQTKANDPPNGTDAETSKHAEEMDRLDCEEVGLLEQLKELETEDTKLDSQIQQLEAELAAKHKLDQEKVRLANMEDLRQMELFKELNSMQTQYELALDSLDTLRKTNIYHETFKISHNGPFGTINGLRLGSVPETPVSWREINAALGQVVLLLSTISVGLNCKIKNYRLQPMGSFSKVLKLDDTTQEWIPFEAYHNEKFNITKIFRRETNFDKAMVCLLEVVGQIFKCIESMSQKTDGTAHSMEIDEQGQQSVHSHPLGDNQASGPSSNIPIRRAPTGNNFQELPYSIVKDSINNLTVKLFGNEPTLKWTTAMKFLLTNVKWLLAFSSSRLNLIQAPQDDES